MMTEEQIKQLVEDINSIAEFGGMGSFTEAGRGYLKMAILAALSQVEQGSKG